MQPMELVLVNSAECELDRVTITVNDPEDCSREVLAALTRHRWILSVGDRIVLSAPLA